LNFGSIAIVSSLAALEVAAGVLVVAAAELAAVVPDAAVVLLAAAVVLEVVVFAAQATRPMAITATRRMAIHFFISFGSS